jgi:hypothetical protein
MGFYRKKPVVIQAIQWTGENFKEIAEFMGCASDDYFDMNSLCNFYMTHGSKILNIKTSDGNDRAIVNDYIIRGVKGEFYPCKEHIFLETYENVI